MSLGLERCTVVTILTFASKFVTGYLPYPLTIYSTRNTYPHNCLARTPHAQPAGHVLTNYEYDRSLIAS